MDGRGWVIEPRQVKALGCVPSLKRKVLCEREIFAFISARVSITKQIVPECIRKVLSFTLYQDLDFIIIIVIAF